MKKCLISLLLLVATSLEVFAANYDTLPKGVRLMAVRRVKADSVNGYWNNTGYKQPYGENVNIDADTMAEVDELNEYFFSGLKDVDAEAYANFTAGEWEFRANAEVLVWGFGGGYGLSDRLTLYGVTTYWNAAVNVKAVQTKANNYQQTEAAVDSGTGRTGVIIDATDLPKIDGVFIQDYITDSYGYEPLGDWQGNGFGDLELGLKYLVTKGTKGGLATSLGFIAPTGRTNNPDIIQDVAFGVGFWSTYLQMESAYHLLPNMDIQLSVRGSLQLPAERQERVPTSGESNLSSEKGRFTLYPGARLDVSLGLPVRANSWFSVTPLYIYEYDQKDIYASENIYANNWLAADTEMIAHKYRIELMGDSTAAYFAKKFPLPASLRLMYEHTFEGQNIPAVSRAELELRLFF